MRSIDRRRTIRALCIATSLSLAGIGLAAAQSPSVVRIGYAVSKTGPNAAGSGLTTEPNYKLWVQEVNAAGGLALPGGKRVPIEVVEYDDRSSSEEVVRAVERLASQDKVDFILPPWGTGFNLAVAPLFDRHGYPQLAVTAVTDKAPAFVKRWKNSFWMLGGGADYARSLVAVLEQARAAGTINDKVAMVSVADGFGIDLVSAARPALKAAKFDVAYDKTYPVGTNDFSPMINEAKASGADTFIAFSYPPETFGMTRQANTAQFSPKVMYVGVGGAFPVYAKASGANIEGIMSLGGVDPSNAADVDYRKRHLEVTGKPADAWASIITYVSLQMLQQSIERVGLDRAKVAAELSSGSFDTAIGKVKLEDNRLRKLWWTGQWQDGHFVGVGPADRQGASKPMIPKPVWK